MGKMLTALLLVLAIELAMSFFVIPWGEGSTNTSMMEFIKNLEDWNSTNFVSYLLNSITILGAGAIIVGTFFSKQDWVWRAGMAAACFFTFGAVIFRLSTFVSGGLAGYIEIMGARTLIVATLVGFLSLYFIMATLDFISGKD